MSRTSHYIKKGKDALTVETTRTGIALRLGPDGIDASVHLSPTEAERLGQLLTLMTGPPAANSAPQVFDPETEPEKIPNGQTDRVLWTCRCGAKNHRSRYHCRECGHDTSPA